MSTDTGLETEVVNVSLVGGGRSIGRMEELLRQMRTGIASKDKRKRWKQPFPGLDAENVVSMAASFISYDLD